MSEIPIGSISYYSLFHDKSEETIRIEHDSKDFEMTVDVPESFDGEISSIRNELYPQIIEEYNDWLMES